MAEPSIPLIERRKLVNSGTSVVLSIPKEWLQENGLKAGDEVIMVANGDLKFMKINKKNVDEIRNKLAHFGLSLKDEIVDVNMQQAVLVDIPKTLREIKMQVDKMQEELRFFGYKIDQIAIHAEKTRKKVQRNEQ